MGRDSKSHRDQENSLCHPCTLLMWCQIFRAMCVIQFWLNTFIPYFVITGDRSAILAHSKPNANFI